MRRLLSTRKLTQAQSERLEKAGWSVVQYDAISIELLPVHFEPRDRIAVFSSKHAVQACVRQGNPAGLAGAQCLCVGERTAALLREKGAAVLKMTNSASDLADCISKKYTDKSFVYYCGDRRLDVLPDRLDALGAAWEEVTCYRTTPVRRIFGESFDGILFFSPSGVESYAEENSFDGAMAFCIGETTAAAARKYTKRYKIAKSPGIDAVVALAISQMPSVNQ